MSTTKYPPTIRRTAGQLEPGDEILIRNRGDDRLWITRPTWDTDARQYVDGEALPTGIHRIAKITSSLHYPDAGRRGRASRYYQLTVDVTGLGERTVEVAAINRLNLIATP